MSKTMNKPDTITATIVYYRLDVADPMQRAEWEQMKADLKLADAECFSPIQSQFDTPYRRGTKKGFESVETELETGDLKCVFENQWNTADGSRVFDWYEAIVPNKDIKCGHYIELTQEIRDFRARVFKCNYCGSGMFSYGWQRPLSNDEAAEWEVRLAQFPAPIEIKRVGK